MPKRRARRPSGLVVSWPRGGSRFVVCGGVEAWSPNPRLLQAAQHSSQEIFCLDNAFALIDGTKMAGQVRARSGFSVGRFVPSCLVFRGQLDRDSGCFSGRLYCAPLGCVDLKSYAETSESNLWLSARGQNCPLHVRGRNVFSSRSLERS